MKILVTLTFTLLTLHLSAQSGFDRLLELSQNLNNGNELSLLGGAITHKLDSILTLDFNDDVIFKSEMEYNAEGQTTVVRQYERDSLTSEIILTTVITMQYDNGPLPTFMTLDALDEETQQLKRLLEYEIFYDMSDRLDSLILSTEDPLSGEFGQTLAIKNVYSGDLLELSRQWYNFGFWIPFSEVDYIYDQDDRLIEEIFSLLNFSTFQLENFSRSVYTYDGAGNRELVTNYFWEVSEWIPESRTMFEYFANGAIKSEVSQIYDGNAWVNDTWNRYHQDVIVDAYDIASYLWENDAWLQTDSVHYTMNPSLPWDNVAAPRELSVLQQSGQFGSYFLNIGTNSILETELYTYSSFAGWLYSGSEMYFYSLFDPSGIVTVVPSGLEISPNPASSDIKIDLERNTDGKFSITSTSGQFISSGNLIQGRNVVRTRDLSAGIYMILIELQDGTTYIHKQIID